MNNCHTWPIQIQLPVPPAPQLAKHWLAAAPPPISLFISRLVQPLNQQSTNQQHHHQSVSHSASQVTQISTKSSQQLRTNLGHLCQTLGLSSNFVWLIKLGSNYYSKQNLAANLVCGVYTKRRGKCQMLRVRKKKRFDPLCMKNMVHCHLREFAFVGMLLKAR